MTVISMNYLLEAGVHFGHQKRRWNPKMKEYIYTTRDYRFIKNSKKIRRSISSFKRNSPSWRKNLICWY